MKPVAGAFQGLPFDVGHDCCDRVAMTIQNVVRVTATNQQGRTFEGLIAIGRCNDVLVPRADLVETLKRLLS